MAGAVPLAAPPALALSAAGSPYEALLVGRTATQAEIKVAYRAMAKRLHPDASRGATGGAAFMEIRRAYETLSDPAERARYDRSSLGPHWRPDAGVGVVGTMRVRRWETDQCWRSDHTTKHQGATRPYEGFPARSHSQDQAPS